MPTYQYACTDPACATRFELVQSFTDPNASECPECEGAVRKVFSAVGVVFKGSGFYRNDSRDAAGKKHSAPDAETSAKSDPSKSDAKSSGPSEAPSGASKPAEKSSASERSSSSGSSSNTKSTSPSSGASPAAASA